MFDVNRFWPLFYVLYFQLRFSQRTLSVLHEKFVPYSLMYFVIVKWDSLSEVPVRQTVSGSHRFTYKRHQHRKRQVCTV